MVILRCGPDIQMHIYVNGEAREITPDTTISELLAELGYTGQQRIAIEVNTEIIPRSVHPDFALSDGDRVELVTAIGGG